jgi:hypothetical protein
MQSILPELFRVVQKLVRVCNTLSIAAIEKFICTYRPTQESSLTRETERFGRRLIVQAVSLERVAKL